MPNSPAPGHMRFIYSTFMALLMPPAMAWLAWRSWRQTGKADAWRDRLGRPDLQHGRYIWVHAASVGEVRSAVPLINALLESSYGPVLVTCFTMTGRQQAKRLFGDKLQVAQIPYDLPFAVNRFLQIANPRIGVLLETELWPNLFAACGRRDVSLLMASARLSERAFRRYRRHRRMVGATLGNVRAIATQTQLDAKRFVRLGAPAAITERTGNLKFEISIPESVVNTGHRLRETMFGETFVWVAGSTREGEEYDVLSAHRQVLKRHPGCTLILAPRHPERAEAVLEMIGKAGLQATRRTSGETRLEPGSVLLLDTVGELLQFYAAADVAFVGGSLVPVGGHNVLEPAALGIPVLVGPSRDNIREQADALQHAGGLLVVDRAFELGDRITRLLDQPAEREHMGRAAAATVAANRGTLQRILEKIDGYLQ